MTEKPGKVHHMEEVGHQRYDAMTRTKTLNASRGYRSPMSPLRATYRAHPNHQRSSADVPFVELVPKAKVPSRAGIEGEKKYSPPFDRTHSVGSVRSTP